MTDCFDCKYAGGENASGQIWCNKKNIYVNIQSQKSCSDFESK